MFVAQGNQIFMNDVFLKRLTAPTITSGGNPPAFSLTPDGKLTAKKCGYQWQCECELRDAQQRHD
ncbi:fibronectin type III domain-containing protein [Escherichia coli]|nr:fibronectin type III domain-containing protein [Escherichia coli]